MSRHNCWNCDYRLEGDPSRCPRCGMPLAGLDAPRPAAAATGAGPAKTTTKKARRKAEPKQQPRVQPQPQPKVEVAPPPAATARSTALRLASGAGKGLRVAATGAGRGLLASLGFARKTVVTGTALSVRTAKAVGSAAGDVASGVRSGGTKLVAYRPKRADRVLEGDILQRENVRTIADVAERLLREAREDNARLAARIAALEARFAADGKAPAKAGAASRKKPAIPALATKAAVAARKAPAAARKTRRLEPTAHREPDTAPRPVVTIEAKAEPAMAAGPRAKTPARPEGTAARRKTSRPRAGVGGPMAG
ncbi:MAG: hypothetical protein IT534_07380 [Bauldia sp.]|nr:hypothetical protein [Bauldia sp.]